MFLYFAVVTLLLFMSRIHANMKKNRPMLSKRRKQLMAGLVTLGVVIAMGVGATLFSFLGSVQQDATIEGWLTMEVDDSGSPQYVGDLVISDPYTSSAGCWHLTKIEFVYTGDDGEKTITWNTVVSPDDEGISFAYSSDEYGNTPITEIVINQGETKLLYINASFDILLVPDTYAVNHSFTAV